jgi:signal peptidase I
MWMTLRGAAVCAVGVVALTLAGCRGNVRAIEKSMEPTIHSGDLVTVDYHAYDDADPQRGDIVSLRAPIGAETDSCGVLPRRGGPCPRPTRQLSADLHVIKRVIALPGERVAIGLLGVALVDGERLHEPYIQLCTRGGCKLPSEIRVPEGHWFMLGDNRPYSSDSRLWGPVPRDAIEGKVDPARPIDG